MATGFVALTGAEAVEEFFTVDGESNAAARVPGMESGKPSLTEKLERQVQSALG